MINFANIDDLMNGSSDKQIQISTTGAFYQNSDISIESMEITEALCSEESLRFGSCVASTFKIRLKNDGISLKGKDLSVTMMVNNKTPRLNLGMYKVYEETITPDKGWKDIVAYNSMYEIISADVSAWYNGLTFPMTLQTFRQSFLSYFGMVANPKVYANDSMVVEKTIDATNGIKGSMVIQAICEANGLFGQIDRSGNKNNVFKYVDLSDNTFTVYPNAKLKSGLTIYPSSVYPSMTIEKDSMDINRYKSLEIDDKSIKNYTGVSIRYEDGDIGATYGTSDNLYVITDNFLMYGKSSYDLTQIAKNLYNVIKGIKYVPFTMEMRGNPCIEVGDFVDIVDTKGNTTTTVILERTLSGIQALNDYCISKGTEEAEEVSNNVDTEIKHLKGKSNVLERSIEETNSRIINVEEGLSSQITQTADSIRTEVSESYVTKDYLDEVGITPANLLVHSDLSYADFNNSYELTNATIDNTEASIKIGSGSSSSIGIAKYIKVIPLNKGDSYCLSFKMIKSNVTSTGASLGYLRYQFETTEGSVTPIFSQEIKFSGIQTVSMTFSSTYTKLKYFQIETISGVELVIGRLKLEKGTTPTEWIPNQQDYATGQVNALRTELTATINQTSKEITSEVAETITKWDLENYSIAYYGYTVPVAEDYSQSDINKYYLDVKTGILYRYVHYGTATQGFEYWSTVKTLNQTKDVLSSTIQQLKDSIVLSIDENGNMVSELDIDKNGMAFVGEKVTFKSNNFELDEEGNAKFSGIVDSASVNIKDSMSLSFGDGEKVNIIKGFADTSNDKVHYIIGDYADGSEAPTIDLIDSEEAGAVAIENADEFFVKDRDMNVVMARTYNESYEQNVLELPQASIYEPFVIQGTFDLQGSTKITGGGRIKQSGMFVKLYGHMIASMNKGQSITLTVDYMFDAGNDWSTMPESENERVRTVARIGDYTLVLTLTEQGKLIVKNIGDAFSNQSFLFRFDYFLM